MRYNLFRRFFDGKSKYKAVEDSRVTQLRRSGVICSSCGELHKGLFDLASDRPEQWPEPLDVKPNADVAHSQHLVTTDLCILDGEHYFVRCVLEIPIIDMPNERFGYGVWSTLSKRNFDTYLQYFDSGSPLGLGPWFSWFSNRLKGYPDTLNLECDVKPQQDRKRPLIILHDCDHPLVCEQRNGISLDRVFEIYRVNGHDLG